MHGSGPLPTSLIERCYSVDSLAEIVNDDNDDAGCDAATRQQCLEGYQLCNQKLWSTMPTPGITVYQLLVHEGHTPIFL